MTIDINARLDQMRPPDILPAEGAPLFADEAAPDGVDQQGIKVAGRGAVIQELIAPLLKKGARATEPAAITQPAPTTPLGPGPTPATPAAAPVPPPRPSLAPTTAPDMRKTAAEREKRKGQPPQAPSPTPLQTAAGVEQGPISTIPFDADEMRATVSALADRVRIDNPTMTVREIYEQSIAAGTPRKAADRLFAGMDMNSSVGGSELSKNLAGLLKLHDDSAAELDAMFESMTKGTLDDNGKLLLRQRLVAHDLIGKQVRGVQVDIARSMNVFKRVRDKGPQLAKTEMQDILETLGSDADLSRIAEAYLSLPDRAGRNRLIEKGLGGKLVDTWIYTWQSNLLNDLQTHAYNLAAGVAHLTMQPIEQLGAVAWGAARRGLGGKAERYYASDVSAGLSAFYNGTIDGIVLAGRAIRHGDAARAKGDAKLSPLTAENFSDTPVRLFGREVARTPDLADTWVGKSIDGLGFLQSLSFRALQTGDEFIGGMAARYQLHQDAWIFGRQTYDDLISSGMKHDDAVKEVQTAVSQFLTERPAQMQANMDDFRNMVTLQTAIDRETALSSKYAAANKFVQHPLVKVFVPFSKTIANLFIEGAARVPGLNLISPRFWNEYNQGGKHRDLAMARLSLGGAVTTTAAALSVQNRVTGSGPSDGEDLKAMEATGWQRYSFVFEKDEISPETMARLGELTSVSYKGDKIYVSYARFDPLSQIFAVGADIADATKFNTDGIDSDEMGELALIAAGANAEYIGSLPLMTGIGEMLQILRSRTEDNGETLLRWFDGMARQYTDVAFTGTPGIGIANSTAVAHIERLVDPTKRSSMADVMDAPYGLRAFYQTRQRLLSRMPYFSKDIDPELDYFGRDQLVNTRGADFWLNYIPIVVAKQGKLSPADEVLVHFNHGISRASQTWDGVKLSAKQYNRYKRLYGQEIKLPVSDEIDTKTGQPKEVNLEQAVAEVGLRAKLKYEEKYGQFNVGDAQNEIDALVMMYRRKARERMIGKWNEDDRLFYDSDEFGPPEFPELRNEIAFSKGERVLKGK